MYICFTMIAYKSDTQPEKLSIVYNNNESLCSNSIDGQWTMSWHGFVMNRFRQLGITFIVKIIQHYSSIGRKYVNN